MKTILINNQPFEVTLPTDALPDKLIIDGNGRFSLIDPRGGRKSGHVAKDKKGIWIFLEGHVYQVSKPVEKRSGASASGAGAGKAELILTSPMPAKVFRVLVKQGDAVKNGQDLIILEAMKMEHAICATKDGIVASCTIAEGDRIDAGETLVVLE